MRNKNKSNFLLELPNYISHRSDNETRPGVNPNGGTIILIYRRGIHRQIPLNTSLNSITIEISLGLNHICISSIYKSPWYFLLPDDIDTVTDNCDWFMIASDLNVKHPLRNSHSANQVSLIIYYHLPWTDYSIIAPFNSHSFSG